MQLGVNHAVGPTTGRKERFVPVPVFVLDELSRNAMGRVEGLAFSGQAGQYLPRPKSSGGWFAAVARARVQKIRPHDLEHSYANLSVSAGVNALALQRMLGQQSAKETLDTYSDSFNDDLGAVGTALDHRYSSEVVAEMWPAGAQATT